ncbi:hypothetical protein PICST_31790 [Scheffersomyces stipitis CBS 6054]|uniref:Uncharacterized protein n=1 Tax=Scheffersomyces stipitis (strain ATCC 58785 / CBS 6054 / NBRC 10063 / NRRL Y-11545) TaxID=322104 RepID=A3LUJ9_PICST|nr:hypothetical protein PICST_31790 [Scheffersomyces stipitis CBS 6054]ABN66251.2 hypothetical protein PICST_31790 [Scheffersomyces stipitis CBS 6054]
MTSHTELIQSAKNNQIAQLRQSAAYSKQLSNTFYSLIKSNSTNGPNTSTLIDKITTIHQLNDEIDKQLNQGIASSFDQLMRSKKRLQILIDDCNIDVLQSRSELIDQDLRILEQTLKLVKNHQ